MDEKDAEILRLQTLGLELVSEKLQFGLENMQLRGALRDMLDTYAPNAVASGTYGTPAVARAVQALNSGTAKNPA